MTLRLMLVGGAAAAKTSVGLGLFAPQFLHQYSMAKQSNSFKDESIAWCTNQDTAFLSVGGQVLMRTVSCHQYLPCPARTVLAHVQDCYCLLRVLAVSEETACRKTEMLTGKRTGVDAVVVVRR